MSIKSNIGIITNNDNGSYEICCQDCNHAIQLKSPLQWKEISRKRRALGDEVTHSLDAVRCQKCNCLIEVSIVEYPEAVIRQVSVSFNKKIVCVDYKSCSEFFETAIVGHDRKKFQLGNNTSHSASLYKSVIAECFKQRKQWEEKYNKQLGPVEIIPKKYEKEFPAAVAGCLGPISNVERVGKSGSITNQWDEDIISLFHTRLGGSVGSHSPITTCYYPIGNCAEQHAANMVMLEGKKNRNREEANKLFFTEAIRPRTMQVIDYCSNCTAVFDTL